MDPQSLTVIANYNCIKCGHKTKTKQQLESHMKKSHKRNPGSLSSSNPQPPQTFNKPVKFVIHPPMNVLPSTPTTLKCPICASIFYKEDYLNDHMATVHKNTDTQPQKPSLESSDDPTKSIPCVLCGKAFSDPASATKHIQTQHELHCGQCDHVCYDKYDLNTHILSTHKSSLISEVNSCPDIERFAYTCILEEYAKTVDQSTLQSLPSTSDCDICDSTKSLQTDYNTHN